MSSPFTAQLRSAELLISLRLTKPTRLEVLVGCELPGVEYYSRTFKCDTASPEEASAFYDDVNNEVKVFGQQLMTVVEELTVHQTAVDI